MIWAWTVTICLLLGLFGIRHVADTADAFGKLAEGDD